MRRQGQDIGRRLIQGAVALSVIPFVTPVEAHGANSEVLRVERIGGQEVTVSRHADDARSLAPRGAAPPSQPDSTSDPAAQAGSEGVTAASAIPPACPVVDRSTDDAANATHPASSAVIKVIYAHPTDVGNRLSTYAPVIQAAAQRVGDVVANESGNLQSLRFDIGTAGGPGCVDIQRIALSQNSSYYRASPQSATFTRVKAEVQLALGVQPGKRNFLVYADGISRPGIAGEAEVRFDDSANGNFQNLGNLWAVLYGKGGSDFFGSSATYAPGTTSRNHVDYALHEISHNLGAVQGSAPHRSAFNHCLDEWDILCYDDDGSGGLSLFVACGLPYSPTNQAWDCGKDDYFNPNPVPGSYLANRWNLTRSVFLCTLESCGPGGTPVRDLEQPTGAGAAVPAASPPETAIIKAPRRKQRRRKAVFSFTGAGAASFECKLDRRPFTPCTSPIRYRRLRVGRHTFAVRAITGGGLADSSPATKRFKVVR